MIVEQNCANEPNYPGRTQGIAKDYILCFKFVANQAQFFFALARTAWLSLVCKIVYCSLHNQESF